MVMVFCTRHYKEITKKFYSVYWYPSLRNMVEVVSQPFVLLVFVKKNVIITFANAVSLQRSISSPMTNQISRV